MIVVKVEIWPGGNLAKSHEIARGEFENRAEIDGVGEYSVHWQLNTSEGEQNFRRIVRHNKQNSVLDLIKKSIP